MTTVLITGGSSGIGKEIAIALAGRGDHVFAVGRNQQRLEQLAADHPGITPIEADVSSDEGQETIQRALDGAELDVFISGAAVCWVAPIEVQTAQQVRETLQTSVEGAILTTRTVLPFLRQSGGAIVMLSSVAAHIGSPGNAVYTASKFAIDGFAESLAYEVADFGIRVRPVQIGHVSTGLISQFPSIDDSSPYSSFGRASQARLRDIGANPKTSATPADVASSVVGIVDDALSSKAAFLRIPLAEEQRSFIQRRHQRSDGEWFDDYKSAVDKYR